MSPDDVAYYRRRAEEERRRAGEAKRANVAAIHMELAARYEALIERAELPVPHVAYIENGPQPVA